MKRGRGRSNVRDLRCGILELARTSGALAEIAVIEREGDESALGKGAAPGAGRLFLHARQGSGQDRDAARITLREMKVPDQTIALAGKLVDFHHIGSDRVPHCRYIGPSLLSNRYPGLAVLIR